MTYCVAIKVDSGLIFCSDSRTNAGVDQVSTYSKMHNFGVPGERQLTIMSAGNLATTQAVIAEIKKDIDHSATKNLLNLHSLRDAADYVGNLNRNEADRHVADDSQYEATFLIGGEINDGTQHEVFLVYPQGNYISTSEDTPFLQIGESKYGKPILDRIVIPTTNLNTAAAAALVSMDSTMRSNLTVGPPIEVYLYKANTLQQGKYLKFEEDSEYLRELKKEWDSLVREAFNQLPPVEWAQTWDQSLGEQNLTS